jgi:hypothetical protein
MRCPHDRTALQIHVEWNKTTSEPSLLSIHITCMTVYDGMLSVQGTGIMFLVKFASCPSNLLLWTEDSGHG